MRVFPLILLMALEQGSAFTVNSRDYSKQSLSSSRFAATVTAPAVNGDATASIVDENDKENNTPEIRLNVFEKARTVTSLCTSGTLCTVSAHEGIDGAPFGSFVDYVLDDEGYPVLLMNEMSMHTINIQKAGESGNAPMVTLFTQLGGSNAGSISRKDLQDVSRCSLTGKVEKIPADSPDMDALRLRYSITHAYADQVMDSPKFAFYRLTPEKIYFVGGFGVSSKWVDVEEYKAAKMDILAAEASDIVERINRSHKEDLKLTAQQLLGIDTPIERNRVTGVDRLGMDIRVTYQANARRNKLITDEYRIGFRIPVLSVEDAKSEILKVFQEAWEKANGYSWGEEEPGSSVPIMKIAADGLQ